MVKSNEREDIEVVEEKYSKLREYRCYVLKLYYGVKQMDENKH